MADTLSLDTAVAFVVRRGGSVRLVGDDQQLAAVGAGGVLRDIQASHGAARLTELHRFADPAEAAASLALRDGRPEALGAEPGRPDSARPRPATSTPSTSPPRTSPDHRWLPPSTEPPSVCSAG
jgi:hypothetical protein